MATTPVRVSGNEAWRQFRAAQLLARRLVADLNHGGRVQVADRCDSEPLPAFYDHQATFTGFWLFFQSNGGGSMATPWGHWHFARSVDETPVDESYLGFFRSRVMARWHRALGCTRGGGY